MIRFSTHPAIAALVTCWAIISLLISAIPSPAPPSTPSRPQAALSSTHAPSSSRTPEAAPPPASSSSATSLPKQTPVATGSKPNLLKSVGTALSGLLAKKPKTGADVPAAGAQTNAFLNPRNTSVHDGHVALQKAQESHAATSTVFQNLAGGPMQARPDIVPAESAGTLHTSADGAMALARLKMSGNPHAVAGAHLEAAQGEQEKLHGMVRSQHSGEHGTAAAEADISAQAQKVRDNLAAADKQLGYCHAQLCDAQSVAPASEKGVMNLADSLKQQVKGNQREVQRAMKHMDEAIGSERM